MEAAGAQCFAVFKLLQVDSVYLFSLVLEIAQGINVIIVLSWLRYQRRKAARSMEGSAHALVLPIYEWLLLAVIAADLFETTVNTTCGFWGRDDSDPFVCAIMHGAGCRGQRTRRLLRKRCRPRASRPPLPAPPNLEGLSWGGQHVVLEGIGFFLLSQGAGTRATRRVAIVASVWGLITSVWQAIVWQLPSGPTDLALTLLYEAVVFGFYATCALLPSSVFFRRPSFRLYAAYWCIYRAFNFATFLLFYNDRLFGFCVGMFNQAVLFMALQPFLVYHVFKRDSQYWQGVVSGSVASTDLVQPLLGNQWGKDSVMAIHSGLDSASQNRVRILNFGFLSLGV